MDFSLQTKRERHFRRMILLDARGDELLAARCDIVWVPERGILPWQPITLTAWETWALAKVVVEQDPATDIYLELDVSITLHQGDDFTITPR